QRFVIREALPRADSIIQITVGGVGTDFDGWYDNLVIPAADLPAPAAQPVPQAVPARPGGPILASVTVSPDTVTFLEAGATRRLAATPRDSSGAPMTVSQRVVWTSSDPAVAQVTQTGLVMGLASGTATIRATVGQMSGTATVTVRLPARPGRRPVRRP
ncbi:MAG: Ig-like domain-containing protein, partial [Gemmatimonadales bacterium]|nr:Ig-like domain-containing protein [Gemmatimonadales bacterium]